MGQFKLKFKINEIEFETEGTYEEVSKERKIFIEQIIPLIANIQLKNTDFSKELEAKEEIKAIEEKVIVAPVVVDIKEKKPTTTQKKKKENKQTKK